MNPEQKQLIFTVTHSSLLSINEQSQIKNVAMSILIAEKRIFIDQEDVLFRNGTLSAVTIFPGNIGAVVRAQHLNILGLISAVFTAINGIASGLSSLSGTAGLIAGFATAFASCSVVLSKKEVAIVHALWRFGESMALVDLVEAVNSSLQHSSLKLDVDDALALIHSLVEKGAKITISNTAPAMITLVDFII